MVKLIKGVKLSKDGDIYIRKEFLKLEEYERHLIESSQAREEELRLAEKEGRKPRDLTLSETALREKLDGKIEKMYQAFDDALEIAPPSEREYLRGKVRARLVHNEQPLFFERPNDLLEECVTRAKLFGMAYLVPGARERILDEVDEPESEG